MNLQKSVITRGRNSHHDVRSNKGRDPDSGGKAEVTFLNSISRVQNQKLVKFFMIQGTGFIPPARLCHAGPTTHATHAPTLTQYVSDTRRRLHADAAVTLKQRNIFFRSHNTTPTLTMHEHSHSYKHTYTNHIPMSIFENWAGKFSRLAKSPQAPRCRRERRLPLNTQHC